MLGMVFGGSGLQILRGWCYVARQLFSEELLELLPKYREFPGIRNHLTTPQYKDPRPCDPQRRCKATIDNRNGFGNLMS